MGFNRRDRSALLVPPAYESGSLGDEASLLGACHHLRQQGITTLGLVSFETADNWGYDPLRSAVDEIVVLPDYQIDTEPFVAAAQRYQQVFCLGADMMDGYYANSDTLRITQLLSLAHRAGAETSLISFSFNNQPTPATVAALHDLPGAIRYTVRDPLSYQRLKRHLTRPLTLTADLALLLQPDDQSPLVASLRNWTQQQHSNNRIVLGVNINNLHLTALPSRRADELVGFYQDALTEVAATEPNLSLLLMPHDQRGEISDVSLTRDLFAALPRPLQTHSQLVPFPCRAAEIKAICAGLDGALTGRMHLAIACLGQAVPVVGIVYQNKFEGLFHHFHLNPQKLTLEPLQAFQEGAIAPLLTHLLAQRHSLQQTIQAALPQVYQLAAANFIGCTPHSGAPQS
ncbi:MAG: polysaccharide pyruvyl transferase family protein [Synechococcales bacterium]|nr:polysaccharide pyruvyl transferase family protein [Synechococcales bacterium]